MQKNNTFRLRGDKNENINHKLFECDKLLEKNAIYIYIYIYI